MGIGRGRILAVASSVACFLGGWYPPQCFGDCIDDARAKAAAAYTAAENTRNSEKQIAQNTFESEMARCLNTLQGADGTGGELKNCDLAANQALSACESSFDDTSCFNDHNQRISAADTALRNDRYSCYYSSDPYCYCKADGKYYHSLAMSEADFNKCRGEKAAGHNKCVSEKLADHAECHVLKQLDKQLCELKASEQKDLADAAAEEKFRAAAAKASKDGSVEEINCPPVDRCDHCETDLVTERYNCSETYGTSVHVAANDQIKALAASLRDFTEKVGKAIATGNKERAYATATRDHDVYKCAITRDYAIAKAHADFNKTTRCGDCDINCYRTAESQRNTAIKNAQDAYYNDSQGTVSGCVPSANKTELDALNTANQKQETAQQTASNNKQTKDNDANIQYLSKMDNAGIAFNNCANNAQQKYEACMAKCRL